MTMQDFKTDTLFLQRIEELADRCRTRFGPEFTHFLDGRNLKLANDCLKKFSGDVISVPFGGFKDAERVVIGVFPKDVYGYDAVDESELCAMFDLCAVKIQGSGFGVFTHRDCMGSVLALGVKREALGDIYVTEDGKCAYMCLTKVAAEYICKNLEFVSRDKVRVSVIDVSDLPVPERRFSVISGTVASERLDCIISLATGLSRDKSKQLINSAMVNVNHFEETRCDFQLSVGDILSVRGHGRFKLIELGGLTKKGRNRVVVHKMI